MEPAQFVPGKKIGTHYLRDKENYLYSRVYNKEERTFWKCIVQNNTKCPATATTRKDGENPEIFVGTGKSKHNHVPDLSKVKKLTEVAKAKTEAVRNQAVKPRTIFSDLTNTLSDEVVPIKFGALARSIQRARVKEGKRPKVPDTFAEVLQLLPEDAKKCLDGSEFLVYAGPAIADREEGEEDDEPVILLFLSTHAKERLSMSKVWLCDGTFKTAPKPFMQVYIIFSQMESGKVLPCGFSLLPNKDKETYQTLWSQVKAAVNDKKPKNLVMDMEAASANAFRMVYGGEGEIKITYCYFHWRKALREQLGKKHCLKDVGTDEKFNKIYRFICALAFVPPEDVVAVVETVIEPLLDDHEDQMSVEASDWCDYFLQTYVGVVNPRTGRRKQAKISPSRWSQFYSLLEELPHTTNAVEGFNSAWNSSSSINNSVWVAIDHMRKEESLAMAKFRENIGMVSQRLAEGTDNRDKRNIAQKDKIGKLLNLVKSYQKFTLNMTGEYIKLVSAILEE